MLFYNFNADHDYEGEYVEHCGCPVLVGEKWSTALCHSHVVERQSFSFFTRVTRPKKTEVCVAYQKEVLHNSTCIKAE
jgi:hypothetical protein